MLFKNHKSLVLNSALILVVLFEMFGVQAVQASTLTVANTNDSGAGSLRQAITNAVSGDTIIFNPALASQTITLASTLVINKDLTIDGSALASKVGVSGNNSVRVFQMTSGISVTLDSLMIKNGFHSVENGGGILNLGTLNIKNSAFLGNVARHGGGIGNYGTLNVMNSTLSGNGASGPSNSSAYGGGIYNFGTLNIEDSTFAGNTASPFGGGGGVFHRSGMLSIVNSTFSGNSARDGGGINNNVDGTVVITNSTFSGNSAEHGGGIINYETLNITNSTFSSNSSTGGGGGIRNHGMMTLTNSTLSSNSAGGDSTASAGGGVYNDGTMTTTTTTFSDNSSNLSGGAVYNANILTIVNNTFSGNFASFYGGSILNGGTMDYTNTILANSPFGNDCFNSGTLGINTNNLVESNSVSPNDCGTPALTSDPKLSSLGENGGPTQTLALLIGSPAIDTGNDANCPATDQRGVARSYGSQCDIGAFEYDPTFAAVQVNIAGSNVGNYAISSGDSLRDSYAGVDNGPAKVISTNGTALILAAMRVIWKEPGFRASYSEMMGLPVEQLSSEYWFPWYNNLSINSMDQGFRIANVDVADTTIKVMLGNTQLDSFTLAAGTSVRKSYNVDNGPIRIYSVEGTNILAALRVIWKEPGVRFSYSEMMGLPVEQLSTEYWFPWYNNAAINSMDQGFRIATVNASDTNTIQVWIGDSATPQETLTLAAGASTRVGYNVDNGPVRIVCTTCSDTGDDKIIAALRVIWKEPGFRATYSEMMGLPKEQLSAEYWFPWYNNLDTAAMDQGFRIANVDDAPHTIRVFLGASQVGEDIDLAGGGSIRVGFAVNSGPIRVVCTDCTNPDDKIIAALRVIWKEPGYRASYSEMMGLPNEALSTEYWFPWYNFAAPNSMDQGFRIAVP